MFGPYDQSFWPYLFLLLQTVNSIIFVHFSIELFVLFLMVVPEFKIWLSNGKALGLTLPTYENWLNRSCICREGSKPFLHLLRVPTVYSIPLANDVFSQVLLDLNPLLSALDTSYHPTFHWISFHFCDVFLLLLDFKFILLIEEK